ncbi:MULTISPECIES: TPM domain-containing protein [unclassified Gilliamella]|uniref:TPM domain-containing protein n=1 Tax=unclassified Gilliamella TaxID=2685620 RepID=UPI00136622A4
MKKYFLCSVLFIVSWFSYGLTDIPQFSHRVIDTTRTLSESQKKALEAGLIDFEQPRSDGAQIAVLMIAKLDNETVEQYADRVFIQWKIGKKGQDNGILLLIVKDDKRMRIEVGYGLEGTITDLVASHIIREQLVPQFQQNNYYQGIDNTLLVLKQKIDNPNLKVTDDQEQNLNTLLAGDFGFKLINYGLVSFFICFLLISLFITRVSAKRSIGTGLLNGLSIGGFTLWQGYPIHIALPLLFLAFVVSTIMSGILTARGGSGGDNNRRGGGFGGSGGGFGGRSGGFGGGGRSGGGGASGSW